MSASQVESPLLIRIAPLVPLPSPSPILEIVESALEEMIPESLWVALQGASLEEQKKVLHQLHNHLPLFQYSLIEGEPGLFTLMTLCPSDHTYGVGRYIIEMLSRWLLPGQQLPISGGIYLGFSFVNHPETKLYFRQDFVSIPTLSDLEKIRLTLDDLIRELKVHIEAVYRARYIASIAGLTEDRRTQLMRESLTPIPDMTLFDTLLKGLSAEERTQSIRQNVSRLVTTRPHSFDRDIFSEMRTFSPLFRTPFLSEREPRHVSRVLALEYLFRKSLEDERVSSTLKLKILPTELTGHRPVLALLLFVRLMNETERFEESHLLETLKNLFPDYLLVEGSTLSHVPQKGGRFYYCELQKAHFVPFTRSEITLLKEELRPALQSQIQRLPHPLFMPRNEEELMRNLVLLSAQIRYVRDLPQAIIQYDSQRREEISFTVLLVRLLRHVQPTLRDLISLLPLRHTVEEIRKLGTLKTRYPKEAATLRVHLEKAPFIRSDERIDLPKARQAIVEALQGILGKFRDFNGGLIEKQQESLEALKRQFHPLTPRLEVEIENFFYSIRPALMRTIHPPELLAALYRFGSIHPGFKAMWEGEFLMVSIPMLPSLSLTAELSCAQTQNGYALLYRPLTREAGESWLKTLHALA